ncbi:MAG: 30S ribosomal protein S20 [Candidatus Geothermincolia bacterium]
MPNIKQQEKRMRQDEKRRVRNKSRKSEVKTYVKRFEASLTAADEEASREALRQVVSLLDKAATDKIIHKNNAARHKSRLSAKFHGAYSSK